MTAETDLLPLVGTLRALPEHVQRVVQSYARANVAHAVVPLQAEVEALRAEVKDYRENGSSAVRFAPNSAHWSAELRRLFGDDARTGIEVLEQRHRDSLARADKLEEALRDLEACANTADYCYCRRPSNFASALVELRESAEKARALLRDQEEGHE